MVRSGVLSAELELTDLDARQVKHWWQLLVPPGVLAQPRWALVVLDRGAVLKIVISGQGAVPPVALPGLPRPGPRTLAGWASQLGVAAVIAVERTLIASLSAEIDGALRLDQDLVAQGLIVLAALKRHAGRGLWTEPALLDVLPAPSFEPVQRTFDRLIPDRAALVGYVIDDDRRGVHASIIAVKAHGDVVRAVTHRALAPRIAEAEASQLSMFVDQIPLALQILEITDPDDVAAIRMVAANRVACENVDATLEELVQEWPRRYAVVDSQPGNLEAFAEVRRTGTSLTKHERSWVDRDGRDRRVNIEAFALGGDYVGVS